MAENCGHDLTRRGGRYDCATPCGVCRRGGHQQRLGPPDGRAFLLRSRREGEGWGGRSGAGFISWCDAAGEAPGGRSGKSFGRSQCSGRV